jgi:subtilase family serine protease
VIKGKTCASRLNTAAILLAALAIIALALSADKSSSAERTGPMVRLPGHVLGALNRAPLIPPTDARAAAAEANQPLTLTIILKRDDQAAFERYLHSVYERHSKIFHHFLTQAEIADRFGPSRADYDSILSYLRANGFKLVHGSANRLTLTMRATRAATEHAFDIHIGNYRIDKKTFYANDTNPALPGRLAAHVLTIAALSDFATPQTDTNAISQAWSSLISWFQSTFKVDAYGNTINSASTTATATANGGTKSPANGPGGWLENIGTGQTIGLVEFDTFSMSDVAGYLSLMGLPATRINNLSQVHVNGGVTRAPTRTRCW